MNYTKLFKKTAAPLFESRFIFTTTQGQGSKETEKPATAETKQTAEVAPVKEKTVDFKQNLDATLTALAENDNALAGNYHKAIEEGLKIYSEMTYNVFATSMLEKSITLTVKKKLQVKVEKNRIIFFHMEGGKEVLDGPKPQTVPIKFHIKPQVNPGANAKEYYDIYSGKVDFKGEQIKKTVGDIFVNLKNGTKITVKAPGVKERMATFDIQDNKEKWAAHYDDGAKEIVKIYSGYTVKLAENTAPAEQPKEKTEYQNYPMIAVVKVGEKEQIHDLDRVIDGALNGNTTFLGITSAEGKQALQRISELFKAKLIDKESYTKFLYDKGAIRPDGTVNLIAWPEKETELQQKQISEDRSKDKKERDRKTTRQQEYMDQSLLNPANVRWLLREGTKIELHDPRLIEAVKDLAKWNELWETPEASPGLQKIKATITDPRFKSVFTQPLNVYRDRIRQAIADGYADQFDLADFIEKIIGREASIAPSAGISGASEDVNTFRKNYIKYMNLDGTAKPGTPVEIADRLRMTMLAGLRFTELQYSNLVDTARLERAKRETRTTPMDLGTMTGNRTINLNDQVQDSDQAKREIQPLRDAISDTSGQQWQKLWGPPSKIAGLKQIQEVINTNPIYVKVKNDPNLAERVRQAFYNGNTDQMDFEDVLDVLLKGKEVKLPGPFTEGKENPRGSKFKEHFEGQDNPPEVLKSAKGMLVSLGAYDNAVIDTSKPIEDSVKLTFNYSRKNQPAGTYQYHVELGRWPATHNLFILDANGTPMKEDYIDDNSEQFTASTLASGEEMRAHFEKMTQPKESPVLDYNNFKAWVAQHFNNKGEAKPGTPPNYVEFYHNVMSGVNGVLTASSNLRYSPAGVESEAKAGGRATNMLRNAPELESLAPSEINTSELYSIEELVTNAGAKGMSDVTPKTPATLGDAAGVYLKEDILGTENYLPAKVKAYRMSVFKYLFQLYDVQSLIAQGCFKQVQLPGGKEEYALVKVPEAYKKYLLRQSPTPGKNILEWLVANPTANMSQSAAETINVEGKNKRIINGIFPPIESTYTMADLESARQGTATISKSEKDLLINRMAQKYANEEFTREVTKDGKLEMPELLKSLNFLLQRGIAGLNENHPQDGETIKARLLTKYPEWLQNNTQPVGITVPFYDFTRGGNEFVKADNLEKVMQDQDIIMLFREGFVLAHSEAIYHRREQSEQKFNEALDNNPKAKELKAEIEKMIKAKKDPKIPDTDIPAIVEEVFPIAFAIGWDTTTNTLGIGAGIGTTVPLSKTHPEYGAFVLGGGATLGYSAKEKSPGVGVGVAAGYQTGKLYGFNLALVGGLGAGVTSEGVSAGPAVGVGLGIPEISAGTNKINATIGVFYHPLVGIAPGVVISWDKDHKLAVEKLEQSAYQAFGADKVDSAATLEAKALVIRNNKQMYDMIRVNLRAEAGRKWQNPGDADLLRHYETWKNSLKNEIRSNYDPGTFSGLSIGFGVDAKTGKLIFGVGVKPNVRQDTVRAARTASDIQSDIERQQLTDLLARDPGQRSELENTRIETAIKNGQIMTDSKNRTVGAGVIEYIDHSTEVPTQKKEIPTGNIKFIKDLEKRLNRLYGKLGIRVEFDKEKGLFELLIPPQNDTNVDIAVDPDMAEGGLVVEQGRMYIGSRFNDPKTVPCILRSDFHYPLTEEGSHYKSIITISDNPEMRAHEIYRKTPRMMSLRNGVWEFRNGMGEGNTANPKFNIYSSKPLLPGMPATPLDAKIRIAEPPKSREQGPDASKEDYYKLVMTEAERTEGRILTPQIRAQLTTFAENICNHPVKGRRYRQLSVEENTTRNVKPLNEFIEKEFKINPPPPPAEIMFSRGELAHASMSELENSPEIKALGGNPDKNSNTYTEAVKRAYERRIESLREIATKEFERLVMQNRRKYQSTDPRYISREAAELSQFAINRAKNAFDKTDPDKDARLLNQIQTTSTLVATLGVLGFRGNINSSDASPDRMMILEQRYEQLLTNKDDIRSDLGKVIIESASPVDKLDTANFEFNNVKQYVENNLTLKVLSQLATPDSAKIFRTEGNISSTQMRAAILKFAASRNDQPAPAIDEATKAALKQLTEITDGIRLAEVTGQTEFRLKHDPNISIQITEFTVADGVYKKCTNYSMWMNESLRLSVVGEVKPTLYSGAAGYGLGKQEIIPSEGGKVMTLVLGAAVRVKVKKERIVNKSENIGKKTTGGLEPEPDAEGTISIGEAVIPADVATKGQDAIQAWLAANGYDPNGNLIPGGGAAPTTGGGL